MKELKAAERFALLEEILADTRPGAAPVDEVVSELRKR